ncbi:puromycin-sensitive aminopeptidase-like [Biomphalaria glabrata]|uniref:Aminopeptidase n=1 Tax=Biomphalaria glabrata TaxID=6526 RepID=A0A9W2Z6D3_BIOGL|nr:puromycin-sensitive aminopeptidase-like [Biomphalaria glabrata]
MSPQDKSFERLPKDVIPSLYHVTLQPDLTAFTFKGWEKVTLEVKQTTRRITMNAFDLSVTKAYLVVDGKLKAPSEIIENEEDELLELSFPEDISPGQFELNLEFSGHLNDQLRGFYRNKYLSENGEVLYAAGTHFEATGARRAYPCWDEPAIKARFIFTLIVPKDKVVLSNMPAEREEISQESSDLKVVTFQPTPIMSTYLTAFVVGDYDFVEAQTSNGIPVRVFTPPGYKEHGLFALEVATKSLSYYEQYFDIPYGLPKLDLITLSEFPIGAMENWGLVIFRETALLLDPANPSAFRKQIVAIIVTHELSHNWFGNLVTMEWWTDLWLKEGFATWISYQCTDALYPEFNIWKQFIKTDQTRALELDALTNSHPIEVPVQHPGEIDEIFDEISYFKGACLIRMLKSYLGDEAFRKGMKLYLKRHQFSNTTNKDMWAAMSEASGSNIEAMMNTWSKQKGFPLIKVSELIDITSNKRQVCLTQQKFVAQSLTSETKGSNPITEQWLVPFSITSSSSPSVPVVSGLLQGGSVTLELPNCKPEDWIHANPGQYMFYHVLYQPDSLQRLSLGVKQNSLSPEDKLGLLIDSFALCQSNYVNVVDVLRLCECFLDETDFSVCGKLVSGLGALRPFVQHLTQGNDQQFDVFLCKSLQKMKSSLGWEAAKDESHATKLIREQILTVLGSSGDPNVVQEASRRFSDYCSKQATLSADIKTPVFVTVLSNGDKEVYDELLEIYDNEDMLEEKNRISRILGLTPNESLIQQTLNFALSDKVRNQDTVATLAGATWTLQGRQLVWKFVQENWQELYRRYSTSTMMSRLIKVITDGVCCAETAKQMENFFKAHQVKNAQRAIQQGLEQIATNVAFIHRQGAALMSFLNDQ